MHWNFETGSKKLLSLCGPTAAGKSALAVELAQKNDGEIISADSRQVYRGLDIATGKITPAETKGVPHHLLDVADPAEDFSVVDFKELADEAVANIHNRHKLPILCGGSGFYIQAVVDDIIFPAVEPNEKLREELSKRSTASLFTELKEKDQKRAVDIDENNPRRIIRALEIVEALGKVPELKKTERFNTLQIGLDLPNKELKHRIIKRTKQRFENGMIEEADNLYKKGLSLERMRELGLEYEHLADFIEAKISKQELFKMIVQSDWQYARRQRTWFRKDERIHWFHPLKDRENIKKMVKEFIEK
jgi:tRNA dimethylallyltransferase